MQLSVLVATTTKGGEAHAATGFTAEDLMATGRTDLADSQLVGLSLPELELTEVLLDSGKYSDAINQLRAVEELERGMIWNSELYRHAVAKAHLEHQTGGDPVPRAERALKIAADPEPQLSRQPTAGLVDASPDEMRHVSNPEGKHHRRRA